MRGEEGTGRDGDALPPHAMRCDVMLLVPMWWCRSWDAFAKKFKSLLWDYIVKQLQQAAASSKST